MKPILEFFRLLVRGPGASHWLKRGGIDPFRFWLLMDLFARLSERRERFSQLGRDSGAIKQSAWVYSIFSAIMAIAFVVAGTAVGTYFAVYQSISAVLLLSMLLPETSNSIVNPIEGLVLAHQPIDGATYTAAKLSHLLRIVVYLFLGFNLVPAFAALLLKNCPWYYPLVHLSAAFAVGLVLALSCCALFGWLIRFVAPARLKAVGFAAEMSPWILYLLFQVKNALNLKVHVPSWLPTHGTPLHIVEATAAVLAITAVVLGIRALSGDYLVRVAAIAHGGSGKKSNVRHSQLGSLVAFVGGGPSALAGFAYLSRMMLRDWQFRRQLLPLIPICVLPLAAASRSMKVSPFSGQFTELHLFPHALGVAFYFICNVIVYGSDHKGAWLFLLAPAGAFRGFARGVYARLFMLLAIPHVVLLVVAANFWGLRDAALFVAYSMAVAAVYLGLEVRLIEGMPFSKQPEATSNPFVIPLMMLGGVAITIAVGLQYFLIFHSVAAVAGTTLVLVVVASLLARSGLAQFEGAIRFHLGLLSNEVKAFYTEVQL